MDGISELKVKLFADGADLSTIASLSEHPHIRGFTTNPSLMRKAGVKNYRAFARDALKLVDGRPISFEILSDETAEMERQACEIASWGPNVFVKVPVTNTRGVSTGKLIRRLTADGIQVNVTAILTLEQVEEVVDCLEPAVPSNVSVFAGRIADTGCDPLPILCAALQILQRTPRAELIWASPRELLNIFQASRIGCPIITVTNDILNKLPLVGKDLNEYSLETVRMFHNDACAAGFRLETGRLKPVAA